MSITRCDDCEKMFDSDFEVIYEYNFKKTICQTCWDKRLEMLE